MTIGQRIRQVRKEKGMRQKDVAKRANIDPNSLSRIERDVRQPTAATIARLAQALGVNPGELFVDTEESISPKDLSLSSLGLRRWLRERGFKYALMSPAEFGEHIVSQDPELEEETGVPLLVPRIHQEITDERGAIDTALRKENVERDSALAALLPGLSPTLRAGTIWRFVHRELSDHYSDLDEILGQFSHELAAQRESQGKLWDVPANSEQLARAWGTRAEKAMDSAIARFEAQEQHVGTTR